MSEADGLAGLAALSASGTKVQIFGMVHSQNVLGPLMIATHYKLGELAFTNLFEDRTPEFKAMNPFNKCPVLKDGDFCIAEAHPGVRRRVLRRSAVRDDDEERGRAQHPRILGRAGAVRRWPTHIVSEN